MIRWVTLLVFAVSVVPPGGVAQAGPEAAVYSLDDPVGDAGPAAAALGFADIVHAEVAVGEEGLGFRIQVAALEGDALIFFAGSEVWLTFAFREETFDAVIETTSHQLDTPADDFLYGAVGAYLYRGAGDDFEDLGPIVAGSDPAGRTYNATVPWGQVLASGDFTPRPGEPVRLLGVHSFYSPYVSTPHRPFISPMGDPLYAETGGDSAAFPDGTLVAVPGAVGDLSLSTPHAVRYSNGEATTMHWPVEVANHGARDLDVSLAVEAPPGIDARAPVTVNLPAGGAKTVSVFATVPFAHDHGTSLRVPLTATSAAGDRTVLQLGVDYPAIPQPAGHHPHLYFHSLAYRVQGQEAFSGPAWMNTLEEDPKADGGMEGSRYTTCPRGDGVVPNLQDGGALWYLPLDPPLRIGLDGRMGEAASLDVQLSSTAPIPPGSVYGRLMLASQVEYYPALDDPEDPYIGVGSFDAASAAPSIHLDLPMPPELDLVAPSLRENLVLLVAYCPDLPTAAGFTGMAAAGFVSIVRPVISLAGGHLVLPLDEYHDVLPVTAGAGPTLQVEGPVVRARPGATVLWRPTATFAEGDASVYMVRVLGGTDAQTLHAPALVEAKAGRIELPVSLVVPEGPTGQIVDLVLDVTATDDPSRTSALRLSVILDPSSPTDHSGEVAALSQSSKDSPSPAFAASVAALALLAWTTRRRRAQ